MIFFFCKSCLPASPQAHSLHSHESLHISRWKVTLATWYLRHCFWVEWSTLGLNFYCLQVGVKYFKCFPIFFCLLFAEYRASRCFLSQPPWHESLGVCVLFAQPGLTLPACGNPPAALRCWQASQSHMWTCGDRTHLCQSQYHSSYSGVADGRCDCACIPPVDLCFCPHQIVLALNNTYILHDQSIFISGHSCALAWILSNLSLPGINVARWITGLERVYKGIMSRLSKMLFFLQDGTYICMLIIEITLCVIDGVL